MKAESLSVAVLVAALCGCPGANSATDQGTDGMLADAGKCLASTPMEQLYEAPCPMGSSYLRCYQEQAPGFY